MIRSARSNTLSLEIRGILGLATVSCLLDRTCCSNLLLAKKRLQGRDRRVNAPEVPVSRDACNRKSILLSITKHSLIMPHPMAKTRVCELNFLARGGELYIRGIQSAWQADRFRASK